MIIPLVEGQSEERAIAGLIRRLLYADDVFDVQVARPFRVKRQQVVREGELERSIVQAERSRSGGTGILVLLDADEDCPAELSRALLARARPETSLPVCVVLPKVEVEAWILAAVDSVRGVRGIRDDAEPPPHPEEVRDAKGALTRLMDGARGYVATDDLPALFEALDLLLAQERSPSFDKFVRDVRTVAGSKEPQGRDSTTW
jgi:hypothetical protein